LAGHDINFMAATGALSTIGTLESGPVAPLNYVADFAGGSLYAAFGICAALLERTRSGLGQTLDVAMADGVLSLMTSLWAIRARGDWTGARGENFLDGGSPCYAVYRTLDGKHMAVGAMERVFRERLFEVLGMPPEFVSLSHSRDQWSGIKERMAAVFETRTQAQWMRTFEGIDACVTPVASLDEAMADPGFAERGALVNGVPQPAPRFSRTPSTSAAPVRAGRDTTRAILEELGYAEEEVAKLAAALT
jgi:alpha-methylacyl-CoA racemase